MTDLLVAAAVDQIDALARRQVSALELLDAYLRRIEERNGELHAIVTLDADRARETARRADTARAGGRLLGPLHGLPFTVKDTLATTGLRTTAGALALRDHVPGEDAVGVARLRAAGAVLVGKTNTPEWAGDYQTDNDLFGRTHNPWDPARTPGGSSGGSAAAVAAGLTSFDIGSDIGGSIRQPAAHCGVFGHKPTFRIAPATGHIPPAPGSPAILDMGVIGPITRAAADLTRLLDVLTGPAADDATAWRLTLPPSRADDLRATRVAVWFDDPTDTVDDPVRKVLDAVVTELRTAGAIVHNAEPPVTVAGHEALFQRLMQPLIAPGLPDATYERLVAAAAEGGDDPSIHQRWARDVTLSARDYLRADEERHRLRARWAGFFEHHDVLLAPVTPTIAPVHDERPPDERRVVVNGEERLAAAQMHWTHPANVCWLPATAVPVGLAGGLPVGVQVIGPRYGDRTTLAFAAHLERLLGGYQRPPGW